MTVAGNAIHGHLAIDRPRRGAFRDNAAGETDGRTVVL